MGELETRCRKPGGGVGGGEGPGERGRRRRSYGGDELVGDLKTALSGLEISVLRYWNGQVSAKDSYLRLTTLEIGCICNESSREERLFF